MAQPSARRPARAGELIEEGVDVPSDPLIGGEQADVGITEGRIGIVVAAADVRVASCAAARVAANDEGELRVCLEAHQAGYHMDPVALEAPGPGEVPRFIEARFQLHHPRHVLARRGTPTPRVAD